MALNEATPLVTIRDDPGEVEVRNKGAERKLRRCAIGRKAIQLQRRKPVPDNF